MPFLDPLKIEISIALFSLEFCPIIRCRSLDREVVDVVVGLYGKLLQIEKADRMGASEKYLIGFFGDKRRAYNEFIEDQVLQYTPRAPKANAAAPAALIAEREQEAKKSVFSNFFGKM